VAQQLAAQALRTIDPRAADDGTLIDELAAAFAAAGLDLRELIVAITQSRAFVP
jgi:hypothetical protein